MSGLDVRAFAEAMEAKRRAPTQPTPIYDALVDEFWPPHTIEIPGPDDFDILPWEKRFRYADSPVIFTFRETP